VSLAARRPPVSQSPATARRAQSIATVAWSTPTDQQRVLLLRLKCSSDRISERAVSSSVWPGFRIVQAVRKGARKNLRAPTAAPILFSGDGPGPTLFGAVSHWHRPSSLHMWLRNHNTHILRRIFFLVLDILTHSLCVATARSKTTKRCQSTQLFYIQVGSQTLFRMQQNKLKFTD